jgi:hypothetical protein
MADVIYFEIAHRIEQQYHELLEEQPKKKKRQVVEIEIFPRGRRYRYILWTIRIAFCRAVRIWKDRNWKPEYWPAGKSYSPLSAVKRLRYSTRTGGPAK